MRLERLAGSSVPPLTVDQHLLIGAIRVRMVRDRNCLCDSHVALPRKLSIVARSRSLSGSFAVAKSIATLWGGKAGERARTSAQDEDLPCAFARRVSRR